MFTVVFPFIFPLIPQCKPMEKVFFGPSASSENVITRYGHDDGCLKSLPLFLGAWLHVATWESENINAQIAEGRKMAPEIGPLVDKCPLSCPSSEEKVSSLHVFLWCPFYFILPSAPQTPRVRHCWAVCKTHAERLRLAAPLWIMGSPPFLFLNM